jgi:hypothetical protein
MEFVKRNEVGSFNSEERERLSGSVVRGIGGGLLISRNLLNDFVFIFLKKILKSKY